METPAENGSVIFSHKVALFHSMNYSFLNQFRLPESKNVQ